MNILHIDQLKTKNPCKNPVTLLVLYKTSGKLQTGAGRSRYKCYAPRGLHVCGYYQYFTANFNFNFVRNTIKITIL